VSATFSDIVSQVRELTFDRFVTPTFFIAQNDRKQEWTLSITSTNFIIKDNGVNVIDLLLADYPTLKDLLDAIIAAAQPIEVIFAGSFIPSEPTSSLSKMADVTLDSYRPVFRSYYFSDALITAYFQDYVRRIMHVTDDQVNAIVWDTEFGDPSFDSYRRTHFVFWVAFQVVGQRRLYELAAQNLLISTLGGPPPAGSGLSYVSSSNFTTSGPGQDVTVQIGDVFTLTEDKNTALGLYNSGEIPKDMLPPWAVGSDNPLMDYYSFWYRLQLWLRLQLEQRTGDYSLRNNTVMTGKIYLDPRDSEKLYSYFDSYPWVFSPYLRPYSNVQELGT